MQKTILSAVTATTTGDAIDISNVENVSIHILAASISSGNGVFTVLGSNDGTNFKALSTLIDNAATVGTRIASKTLSSNTSDIIFLGNDTKPRYIQVKVTVTTDGIYSAFVSGDKKL